MAHRSLRFLALLSLLIGAQACGNAFEHRTFGTEPSTNSDAGPEGSPLLPFEGLLPGDADLGDSKRADDGTTSTDATSCVPSMNSDLANICVHVFRDLTAPAITIDTSKELQIDGLGTLTIGLTRDSTISPKTSWVAVINFPSPSTTQPFNISDLPKQSDFSVAPGTYYAFALFRDRPSLDQTKFEVGDYIGWVQSAEGMPQPIQVSSGQAVDLTLSLQAIRAMTVEVKQGNIRPLGNGTGPLQIALTKQASSKAVLTDEWFKCVDIFKTNSYTTQLYTYGKDQLFLHARLYDYSVPKSFEDPIPSGTLISASEGLSVFIPSDSWIIPKQTIEFSRVVPFSDGTPIDPTPYCSVVIP